MIVNSLIVCGKSLTSFERKSISNFITSIDSSKTKSFAMDSEHDHIVIWFTFKNSYGEEAIDPKYLWENIEKQSRYYTKFIPYMLSNIANEAGYTMTTMKIASDGSTYYDVSFNHIVNVSGVSSPFDISINGNEVIITNNDGVFAPCHLHYVAF